MYTAVVLPGMDGTGDLLTEFGASLSQHCNVKIVRYPLDAGTSYRELIRLVEVELPNAEPYFLIAESFSGPIAIAIGANRPPRLAGIVLCCSFARNPRYLLSKVIPFTGLIPVTAVPYPLIIGLTLGKWANDTLRAVLRKVLSRLPSMVASRRLAAIAKCDMRSELARITVPFLYLAATSDRLVPAKLAAEIVEALPSAQITKLDGPHFLLSACPSESSAAIAQFMQEVMGRKK